MNVDERGSGTALTASIMFDSLSISTQTAHDDQVTALRKVRRGEITASFT